MKIIINENQLNILLKEFQEYDLVPYLKKGYILHGSPLLFSQFDEGKIKGGMRSEYGYGIYFADEAYKCIEYGDYIYMTPKSLYNFWNLDNNDISAFSDFKMKREELSKAEYALENCRTIKEYEYYEKLIRDLKDNFLSLSNNEDMILNLFFQSFEKYPNNLENAFKFVKNNIPSNLIKLISVLLMKLGYDGVKCGNQYVIFNFPLLNNNFSCLEK